MTDIITPEDLPEDASEHSNEQDHLPGSVIPITGLYENWFLDYASYVILERAVPAMEDGLKPVQRRILHAMKEMDDGRFNKVANIIGQTMQYHPHGDAAIGEAMVGLGQKDLLIETQGNWGDIRTGDSAAASRYIEARLSKFAHAVAFNEKITEWQLSYDGRKKEPVTLPMKFPLLLAQGVEGIAVGLATKILPHNFCELLRASIDILKGKPVTLLPDFPTGGLLDAGQYNNGLRGGKVRVRARIEEIDKKTLAIREIPFGTTTGSLIDSILKANDQGKIRIKKVVDNTARDVEVEIQLAPGMDPDITIDALYAFTDCEVSISPNACVIIDDKPVFIGVTDILKFNTEQTMHLLRKELEIKLSELETSWHFSSLEKIFIENRIYRDIEECETWESVLETIDKGLEPFKKLLRREVTRDDIVKLTEIRIKRISKYDAFKADEELRSLENEIAEVKNHLEHLRDYAINYYEQLLKNFGKGRERKTELRAFDNIDVQIVAAANTKFYANKKEGFIGTGLKKDEFLFECSDIDDIVVIRHDGCLIITKVADKTFVGKDIKSVEVFRRNDDRHVYNLVYHDGATGYAMVKRFNIGGVTRDKDYSLTKGTPNSRVLYLSSNPNAEAEIITVYLSPNSKARKLVFDFDFASIGIKGRSSQGNILCKYPVKKIELRSKGVSTLGGRNVWFDAALGRLNYDGRGKALGQFQPADKILVMYKSGEYEITNFELTNRYEPEEVVFIEKYYPGELLSAVYFDGGHKAWYGKRFVIETQTEAKKFKFIPDAAGSKLEMASSALSATIKGNAGKGISLTWTLEKDIEPKGWKAQGTKLADHQYKTFEFENEIWPERKIQPEIENDTDDISMTDLSEVPDPEIVLPSELKKSENPGTKNPSQENQATLF